LAVAFPAVVAPEVATEEEDGEAEEDEEAGEGEEAEEAAVASPSPPVVECCRCRAVNANALDCFR
jgi:hypothetical protein